MNIKYPSAQILIKKSVKNGPEICANGRRITMIEDIKINLLI